MIRILSDALTSPARLVERFGAAGMPSDQLRKLLSRAARMAAALVAHRGNEQSSFASSSRKSSSMRRRSPSSCGAALCWAGMSRHAHLTSQATALSS